jgi:hypothetical protein
LLKIGYGEKIGFLLEIRHLILKRWGSRGLGEIGIREKKGLFLYGKI